ncbi:MAG: hypothetical protein PWP27_2367 [Clostridiales bacterium]|jgi:hypothetical protein|nr:hypothetical protein [Clostridiales bacterium]MDK2934557.1 hypothetical protein [Clostridiales bacterium]
MIGIFILTSSFLIIVITAILVLLLKDKIEISLFTIILTGAISLILTLIFPYVYIKVNLTMITLGLLSIIVIASAVLVFIDNKIIISTEEQIVNYFRYDKNEYHFSPDDSHISALIEDDEEQDIEDVYSGDEDIAGIVTSDSKNNHIDSLIELDAEIVQLIDKYLKKNDIADEASTDSQQSGLITEDMENNEYLNDEELKMKCEEVLEHLEKDWLTKEFFQNKTQGNIQK